MPSPVLSEQQQTLAEDLQIVRVTLETISGDVRNYSGPAADAIHEAVERLERAEHAFVRPDNP